MGRGRKTFQNGRSKGEGQFVALRNWFMNTVAWKSLTPAERAVYIAIAGIYNGANNGFLGLGARKAADHCRISKNTATVAFRTLQERGFIECASPGGFSLKLRHQTEWRLTAFNCDRTGAKRTEAFKAWKPPPGDPWQPSPAPWERRTESNSRSQSAPISVPIEGQNTTATPLTVPDLGPSGMEQAA